MIVKKYRKKPVVVEAVQFTDENKDQVLRWVNSNGYADFDDNTGDPIIKIQTLEGVMTARFCDYIIKGIKGEFCPCKPDIFKQTYEEEKMTKTLHNSCASQATKNVPDIVKYGDADMFQLLCKASSKKEGWMKSTKAMEIPNVGCIVQVTTQQGDNVAEAVTFVPGVVIVGNAENGRTLQKAY